MKYNNIINLFVLTAPFGYAAQPSSGVGVGGACNTIYKLAGSMQKYTKDTGNGALNCADGLVCMPIPQYETPVSGTKLAGTCNTTMCAGNSDPEDLSEGDINGSNEATIRVTICHRTCSQTNPWVRITIDDDAWNGTHASGCGHQQHDVRDECAKYGPINNWAAWGKNKKDYLLKWHGTREYVRSIHPEWFTPFPGPGNSGMTYSEGEKDYWKNWERACPYVRGTGCCNWAEGSCCGDDPSLVPAIDLQKTAGPRGTCGVDMSQQVEVYLGTEGDEFEYCYHITNTGQVCLEDMTMTDTLISTPIAMNTPLTSFGFGADFKLCPTEDIFVTHQSTIPEAPEGPIDAIVEGTQEGTQNGVEDSDHAAVVPAGINVEKTAGPPGTCGVDMSQQVELFGGALGADFEWCYTITNPSGVCLKDVTMSDSSAGFTNLAISMTGSPPAGITLLADPDFVALFCPGEVVYVDVNGKIPSGGSNGPATVTGTPDVDDSPPVTDTDPAGVVPAAITLQKTAGPTGSCGGAMSGQVESYTAAVDAPFDYCYAISVPAGGICVNSILMSDSDISDSFNDVQITSSTAGFSGGPANFVDKLCAGQTVYYKLPSNVPGPNGESKIADVSGVGVVAGGGGPTVTDEDPAGVAPPDAPPVILLEKTAGPPGTCGIDMTKQVELYKNDEGMPFEYCYTITNPGAICLNHLLMEDTSISGSFTGASVEAGLPGFVSGSSGFVDTLCAGQKVYYKKVSTMPGSKEGPFDAKVTGTPVTGGTPVTSTNPAAVEPIPPIPVIELQKTAGPPGSCGVNMENQVELYTDSIAAGFEYCYAISVPHDGVCINNLLMSDPAGSVAFSGDSITSSNPNVMGPDDFIDTLCGGQTVYFTKPSSIPLSGAEGPFDGKVDGQGPDGTPVSATDPAAVAATVVINLEKTAGPRGTCGVDMTAQMELYTGVLGTEFEYCYEITNPGGVCLKNIKMSDTSISTPFANVLISGSLPSGITLEKDGLNFVDKLCAGQTVYLSVASTIPGDELEDAIVNAVGDTSANPPVSDQDHAGVAPTEDIRPCTADMPGKGSDHCGTYEGVEVISVVGPADSPWDADILWQVSAAPDGKSVSFKVTNPFEDATNIYTQYHAPSGTGGGGWYEACAGEMDVPECGPNASVITADCVEAGGDPFSIINVYFVSSAPGFLGGSEVDECCHAGALPPGSAVAQYTFLVGCTCPSQA